MDNKSIHDLLISNFKAKWCKALWGLRSPRCGPVEFARPSGHSHAQWSTCTKSHSLYCFSQRAGSAAHHKILIHLWGLLPMDLLLHTHVAIRILRPALPGSVVAPIWPSNLKVGWGHINTYHLSTRCQVEKLKILLYMSHDEQSGGCIGW